MTEDFLQFAWKFRLFNSPTLYTETGDPIEIIHPGTHNSNGGPDFLDARLRIAHKEWVGHVEVHVRSSDWFRHGHQRDDHYKSVILHVVYRPDEEVFHDKSGELPVLNISKYLGEKEVATYQRWMNSKAWIPCQERIGDVSESVWLGWKDRLAIEKLESRYSDIMRDYHECKGNWNEVFYRRLAKNMGFRVNSVAMEMLSRSVPYRLLSKLQSSPLAVNAVLFGQSGMLHNASREGYPGDLHREYAHLKKKYHLTSLQPVVWNYSRMRPHNFPTVRIAQLASMVCAHSQWINAFVEQDNNKISGQFGVRTHPYWSHHFVFPAQEGSSNKIFPGEELLTLHNSSFKVTVPSATPSEGKIVGRDTCLNLTVNTVVPMMFAYGRYRKEEKYIDKSLNLLQLCGAEHNRILKQWLALGVVADDAMDSIALVWLYDQYCVLKRCLDCRIGTRLIRNETE